MSAASWLICAFIAFVALLIAAMGWGAWAADRQMKKEMERMRAPQSWRGRQR